MTIQQVLNCSAEELEAMSDKELFAHFEPMLPKTRPELIVKESPKKTTRSMDEPLSVTARKKRAMDFAKQMGLDLDDIL